jgi:hypothetical protein
MGQIRTDEEGMSITILQAEQHRNTNWAFFIAATTLM